MGGNYMRKYGTYIFIDCQDVFFVLLIQFARLWPSLPVITFFPISEFSYKLIKYFRKIFLLRYGMSQADSASVVCPHVLLLLDYIVFYTIFQALCCCRQVYKPAIVFVLFFNLKFDYDHFLKSPRVLLAQAIKPIITSDAIPYWSALDF